MKKIITTSTLSLLMVLSFNYAHAASSADTVSVKINCIQHCEDKGIIFSGIKGQITTTVKKVVNFVRQTGNITNLNFNLNIGKIVTLDQKTTDTSGDWFFQGGEYDSPPADGVFYKAFEITDSMLIEGSGGVKTNRTKRYYFAISKPSDSEKAVITSNNPAIVSCDGKECTALKAGTATVDITFPNSEQTSNNEILGRTTGFGKFVIKGQKIVERNFPNLYYTPVIGLYPYNMEPTLEERANTVVKTYQFPKITYTITVPPNANQDQVSSCQSITNVTQNSGQVNWAYTDADSDKQTNYKVQISKDAVFSAANIVKSISAPANTDVSNTLNTNITGLTPNTTYYAQVATYNDENNWSSYSVCSSTFKTTANNPQAVAYTNTDGITETSATVHWTYSDPENDAQTGYEVGLSKDNFVTVSPVKLSTTGNNSAVRTATFAALDPDTTYKVRVRATNASNGWSVYSTGSFTTKKVDTTALNVSCQPQGSAFYVNKNVTLKSVMLGLGTAPYTFTWSIPGYPNANTQDITKKFNTTGKKNITLQVKDASNATDSESCSVDVTCDPADKPDDGVCVSGKKDVYVCGTSDWESTSVDCGGGTCTGPSCPPVCTGSSCPPVCTGLTCGGGNPGNPAVAQFSFQPYIADNNDMCSLVLEASSVNETAGCMLTSPEKTGYSYYPQTGDTKINITKSDNNLVKVGTWQLSCTGTGTGATSQNFGVQKCVSNPGIKEN